MTTRRKKVLLRTEEHIVAIQEPRRLPALDTPRNVPLRADRLRQAAVERLPVHRRREALHERATQPLDMPRSPEGLCLDCSSRVVTGTKYCIQHQQTNNRRSNRITFDQFRADDEVRKLYRTARWKAVRQAVFKRDGYLCTSCGFRAATECDHTPRARVLIDTFGRNEFFAISRLTSLCSGCHKSKTRHELGFARGGTNLTKDDLGDRSRTTVVCGQAASGKTTYVDQHKAANDLVWDYDVVMSELTGLPMHESLPEAIGSVLANRDNWIRATRYTRQRCWLIVSNPKAAIVELMREAGATVIVMDTPDDVCQRRLRERYMNS